MERYSAGLLMGFFMGILILHPFSMVYQGLFFPSFKINLKSLLDAFHPEHLPMAFFFGLLGMSLGVVNVYYLRTLSKTRKRVKILEGLLPICSYCK